MVSDTLVQGVVGIRAGFDRIYRINRIERGGEGTRKARKSRGNHAEGGGGNSNWWQGYANAPPAVMASVPLRDCRMAFGVRHPRAVI